MELWKVPERDTLMTITNEAAQNEVCLQPAEASNRRTIRHPSFRLSDIWRAPLNDFPIRDEILYRFLPLSMDLDVLEIGPGSGFTAFRLARQVHSLTLVDVAAQSLASVRENLRPLANVRCICADPSEPGLAEELKQEFDVAFALDVFEYIVDPGACLRNLVHVLRPRGELFLTYPNVPPPQGDGVTYFSRLSELENLLERVGFRRWDIFEVRQRPFARWAYFTAHEYPLQIYRQRRSGNPDGRPQTYEGSWVFKHSEKLGRYKVPLHMFWYLLDKAIRLGGDVFESEPLTDEILGRQLVIRAWK
jgi:SAM-dependent methyltransferase